MVARIRCERGGQGAWNCAISSFGRRTVPSWRVRPCRCRGRARRWSRPFNPGVMYQMHLGEVPRTEEKIPREDFDMRRRQCRSRAVARRAALAALAIALIGKTAVAYPILEPQIGDGSFFANINSAACSGILRCRPHNPKDISCVMNFSVDRRVVEHTNDNNGRQEFRAQQVFFLRGDIVIRDVCTERFADVIARKYSGLANRKWWVVQAKFICAFRRIDASAQSKCRHIDSGIVSGCRSGILQPNQNRKMRAVWAEGNGGVWRNISGLYPSAAQSGWPSFLGSSWLP